MSGGHAFLAPSSAGCTVNCAAAPRLQALYPEAEDSEAAREGTAAHWVGAHLLTGAEAEAYLGAVAPNGVIVDSAMIEAAEIWADDVHGYDAIKDAPLYIERYLPCLSLDPTGRNGGTPDAWAWIVKPRRQIVIPVWDFKYGHGLVDVFENWQLINYAAAILEACGVNGLDDQDIHFDFRIVQPRASHMDGVIRSWIVRASDLRARFNILAAAYAQALLPDGPAKPGSWCRTSYCSAAHACEALQRASYHVVEFTRRGRPHELTPQALGLELKTLAEAKAMIDARVDALKEQATVLLKTGKQVPYWSLERGKSRDVIPPENVKPFLIAGELMGKDFTYKGTARCCTVKQAVAMGANESAVMAFSKPMTGETKLIQDNMSRARRAFGP